MFFGLHNMEVAKQKHHLRIMFQMFFMVRGAQRCSLFKSSD